MRTGLCVGALAAVVRSSIGHSRPPNGGPPGVGCGDLAPRRIPAPEPEGARDRAGDRRREVCLLTARAKQPASPVGARSNVAVPWQAGFRNSFRTRFSASPNSRFAMSSR